MILMSLAIISIEPSGTLRIKREIEKQIEEQREHFDNLDLHIGYVHGSTERPANASHFSPKFVPGARLPHAWLGNASILRLDPLDVSYVSELSAEEIERRRYSSLDLCERDGFTVLVGPGSRWKHRVGEFKAEHARTMPPVYVKELDVDFHMADTPNSAHWVESMELYDGRVVVLRPDQHILGWLAENDSATGLLNILSSHLGRDIRSNDG